MQTPRKITGFILLLIVTWLFFSEAALAQEETKTFIAYSMRVAQERVKSAISQGEDFRKTQPDLYYLGGITKPWAVIIDQKGGDWILVGEKDPKLSLLTLDDWVVALRARFIHTGKDPDVSIDPRPCDACVQAGKREGCRHYKQQDVRFFGGIENTHFGQVCFEADWLMKKIGMGLERLPVEKLKIYYDLSKEQLGNSGAAFTSVSSRFWFYPIVNRVNVFADEENGDVVLLEKFQMGVFTEVMYAEVGGNPVADLDKFNFRPSEEFSRSFSENSDAIAQAREVIDSLRGMTRVAGLAKGLVGVGKKPKAEFYLSTAYPVEKLPSLEPQEVLMVGGKNVGFEIQGGVQLMALAMRLQGGDVTAWRDLVLRSRSSPDAITWGFEMEIRDGQLKRVKIPAYMADPSQIASLFSQARFLYNKKRYDAAIEGFLKVLDLSPNLAVAYYYRGYSYTQGVICRLKNRPIHLPQEHPNHEEFVNKFFVRHSDSDQDIHEYSQAISDYTKALNINPNFFDLCG